MEEVETIINVFASTVQNWIPCQLNVRLDIDHRAVKYLMNKNDAKPCPIRWILLLQEIDMKVKDRMEQKKTK